MGLLPFDKGRWRDLSCAGGLESPDHDDGTKGTGTVPRVWARSISPSRKRATPLHLKRGALKIVHFSNVKNFNASLVSSIYELLTLNFLAFGGQRLVGFWLFVARYWLLPIAH
jgi:hypothetical protein